MCHRACLNNYFKNVATNNFGLIYKGYIRVKGVLSGNHKTKSAVLFRLLTKTKEASEKSSQSDKHIKRKRGKGR